MKYPARLPPTSPVYPVYRSRNTRVWRRLSVLRILSLARENAELRQTVASLRELSALAYRDSLTGLWNRRFFEDRMAEELGRARRERERPFTLVMIDVNDMKRINDKHGHETGDRALRWVARLLVDNLRSCDLAFRLGGDEFALVLPNTRGGEASCLIARLRRHLAVANVSRDVPIGLSFGAATSREGDTSDLDIFVRADEAMYEDKRQQRPST